MGFKWEPKIVELTDEEVRCELHALEEKHRMTSSEFLVQFNKGNLGDDPEFILWAGLIDVAGEIGVYPRLRV